MTEQVFTVIFMGRDGYLKAMMPRNPRKRPRKNQRRKIIKGRMSQDDRCYYCRIKMVFREDAPYPCLHDDVTLEHKTPIVRGADGRRKKNIVLACYSCNQNKAEMTEEEFKATAKFKLRVQHVQAIGRKNEYRETEK